MGGFLNNLVGGEQGLASAPPGQTALPGNIAAAQSGVTGNIANQNAFATALQNQMNGGGPNLAGSLLSNATGQNVQNTAALMAGQRGTGSNPGLLARQAATQGATIQQNAAGQAAAERAQQQLSAQSGLANTYGTIGQEQGQNLATNQQALTGQNQQTIQTNQTNATIGGNNATANSNAVSGLGQGAVSGAGSISSLAGMLADGGEIQNFDDGGDVNNSMFAPGAASMNIPTQNTMDSFDASNNPDAGLTPKPAAAASGGSSKPTPAKGTDTQNLSQAPVIDQVPNTAPVQSFSSQLPDHLQSVANIFHPQMMASGGIASNVNQPSYNASSNAYAKGGTVKALVSPGEQILKPKDVKKVADGKANPMSVGGKVPGKAKVPGAVNSYANDTKPDKLEVGSIVIPRSVTQSKNPGKDASAFVMAIINKKNKGGK